MRVQAIDVIAMIIVVGCLLGMLLGGDGAMSGVLITVVAYYFGRKASV